MTGIDLVIEEAWFPRRWYRPWRRRYWSIQVVGHGRTQAMHERDVYYMARDLMACIYDTYPDDYTVRRATWLR